MKTFKEFILEAKLRMITVGPSRSPVGRQRQQKYNSERAAFRRAGLRRNRQGQSNTRSSNKISFNAVPTNYSSTAITSYPNQSSYAKDMMPPKVDDRKGVTPTKNRVLYLRRLARQIGRRGTKKVHAVDILPRKDFSKNDPKELITRGKEYNSAVGNISHNIKTVSGGKPGDVIVGKAAEVMRGAEDMTKGRKKRERFYSKKIDASPRDPITNVQKATVK